LLVALTGFQYLSGECVAPRASNRFFLYQQSLRPSADIACRSLSCHAKRLGVSEASPLLTGSLSPISAVGLRAMSFRNATPGSANAGTISHQPKWLFAPSGVSSLAKTSSAGNCFRQRYCKSHCQAQALVETAPMFTTQSQLWVRPRYGFKQAGREHAGLMAETAAG